MSFQAKSNLVMLIVLIVVYVAYALVIVSWAETTAIADITWQH